MAKSRSQRSPLDQVGSLLTAGEKRVLQASTESAIAKATRQELVTAMAHARTLRDKWRDLHAKQSRTTKRSDAAGSAVNQRTRDKHDVFADAVKRLEARLATSSDGARPTAKAKPSVAVKPTAAKPVATAKTAVVKPAAVKPAVVKSAVKSAKPVSKPAVKATFKVAKPKLGAAKARRVGHVMASNKRSQARRDGRSR
ncbi:MAG: hypothetical protein K8S94_00120 [Planctomycetia bacterium]|nr:hypothetical protein [Planctomycetia bacterium]